MHKTLGQIVLDNTQGAFNTILDCLGPKLMYMDSIIAENARLKEELEKLKSKETPEKSAAVEGAKK